MTNKSVSRRRFLEWSAGGAAVIAGSRGAYAQANKPTLKFGFILGVPVPIIFAAKEKGFFDSADMNMEFVPFNGGAPAVEALVAGSIHIAHASPIVQLYLLQRGFETVAIASMHEGGPESFVTSGMNKSNEPVPSGFWAVLPNSPIKSVKDFRGKVVCGGNTYGSWPDVYSKKMLKDAGLSWEKDVKYTTMGFGAMPDALAKGQVDVVALWEPFYTVARLKYNVRTIFTDLDVNKLMYSPGPQGPIGSGGVALVQKKFLNENRPLLNEFGQRWKKAMDWCFENDSAQRELLVKGLKLEDRVAKTFINPQGPRNCIFDASACKRDHDLMVDLGFLKKPIPDYPKSYLDFSVVGGSA
jgi:ABC-type nitrate/sulfonate/bicarbonate transport system substrate-binding protein